MLPLRLSEIAELVGGVLIGTDDPQLTGAAGLADAGLADLSFVADAKRLADATQSNAGALLVGRNVVVDKPRVEVDDPYRAFVKILAGIEIDVDRVFPPGVHPTAVIDPTADVSQAVSVGPYCVIGAGTVLGAGTRLGSHVSIGCDVTVGDACTIYAQVVIREGCRLGNRVIVHASVVLGADGFGYLPGPEGLLKIPQVGIVDIADDVEFGAGSTVDRATTGRTVIGTGTKIDNQVQIAHNAQLGSHCAMSAQSGIAGSAKMGDGVICGGQVGIGDHLSVGAGSKIGGQTGVIQDLAAGSRVFGTPATDSNTFFRVAYAARRLPELQVTVRDMKQRIAVLEQELAQATGDKPGAANDQES